MNAFRVSLILTVAILAATSLSACTTSSQSVAVQKQITSSNQIRERGSVVSVEHLENMDQPTLQKIAADFPGNITAQNGASLYRVTYWTELKGEPVIASGLFSIPDRAAAPKGVYAYFHGTNATRAFAPSEADRVDGNEDTAIFAGNGYYVVLPDYIGLGASKIPQQYLLTKPNVDASIDMLIAVRQIVTDMERDWSPSLFMMGFSQGGQVVAGVHRELERNPVTGFDLKGSIGIAGPYDLRITSLPKALENECLLCVGYLAWGANAYASYYDQSLDEALHPEYAKSVPLLFDGSKSELEIAANLPDDPRKLFRPEFLATIRANQDNWFTKALDDNETYAWVPVAPMRLYFGDADKDVTPEASKHFYNYAKPRGGNISMHSIGAVDHMTSASMTQAEALAWFDKLGKTE